MDLSAPLNAFVAGFPDFIIQLGVALGLFVASLFIYTIMTPHKELALIRAGNPSAALAYCGRILRLAVFQFWIGSARKKVIARHGTETNSSR